jgi:predicted PurR-regulated permease PerM
MRDRFFLCLAIAMVVAELCRGILDLLEARRRHWAVYATVCVLAIVPVVYYGVHAVA